jgi:hypothetical protein
MWKIFSTILIVDEIISFLLKWITQTEYYNIIALYALFKLMNDWTSIAVAQDLHASRAPLLTQVSIPKRSKLSTKYDGGYIIIFNILGVKLCWCCDKN